MPIFSQPHLSTDSSSATRSPTHHRHRRVSTIALIGFALLLMPIGAQAGHRSPARLAGPFSAVYFFGDSLSDAGNFVEQLDVDSIPGVVPGQDGAFYWENRFSNGPTWADQTAKALGHSSTASLLGGTNYARGGAHNVRPNPNPAFNVLFSEVGWLLSEQIGEYLASSSPGDPHALHVIFMGSNDFPVGGALDPAPSIAEIVSAIEDLHGAGARQFLVWSLFPFEVPGFEPLVAFVNEFNELLAVALDGVEDDLDGIVITRANLVEAMGPLLADPLAFGFTNPGLCTEFGFPFPPAGAGDPACEAETLTDTFFGRAVGDTFLSHDAIHFTTRVYQFWSDHAIRELCKTRIRQFFPGRFGERIANFLCER